MKTEGLRLAQGDIETSSALIAAIQALPDGSIEGLSGYDPSSVTLEDKKIVIRRPCGHGDPLTVNFPEGSTKNIARGGMASFDYLGHTYHVYH